MFLSFMYAGYVTLMLYFTKQNILETHPQKLSILQPFVQSAKPPSQNKTSKCASELSANLRTLPGTLLVM